MKLILRIAPIMAEQFEVSSDVPVKMFKRMVSLRLHIPMQSFELYSKSDECLSDKKCLSDYEDIEAGEEINLKMGEGSGDSGLGLLKLRYGSKLPTNLAKRFIRGLEANMAILDFQEIDRKMTDYLKDFDIEIE